MTQVKWRARAVADVERLYTFLHKKDGTAARQMAYLIFQAASRLETSSQIGRPIADGTGRRELIVPFGAGAYVLRYFLEGDNTIVVVRVWHSKESRGH